jgi:hypothetical protein
MNAEQQSHDAQNPTQYKVGTLFRVRAKLTDRQGGGEFLYSYSDGPWMS